MRIMDLRATRCRPRTSRPAPGGRVYPHLLRNANITRPNQAWAADVTGLPMAPGSLYLWVVMEWMTVSSHNSVTAAAEIGLKACYWQPPAARIRPRMELYAEVRSALEERTFKLGEDQAVVRSTYVASSIVEARRDAEAGIMLAFTYNDPFRGRQVFTNPGEEFDQDVKLDWDFVEPSTLLVGSPDNVIEKIHELQEVCSPSYLLVEFTHPGLPIRKTLQNLENFATEVMPRLVD